MLIFTIFNNLWSDIMTRFVVISQDKGRHIMSFIATHEVNTWRILCISHPLSIFQSVGKFIVLTNVFEFLWYWILVKSVCSVQMTIIDFDCHFSRLKEWRVKRCFLIWFSIDNNRQLNIDIPQASAEEFWCWIVERRRLSIGSKLAFCGMK